MEQDEETGDAPPTVDDGDPHATARRRFLAFLGGTTALLAAGTASAKTAAGGSSPTDQEASKLVADVWGYAPPAKARLTQRASKLTLGDLDALRSGKVTDRTKAVTWQDLSSLVDALGDQYGMNKHPFNPSSSVFSGGKPSAASCCCCCTCCCGDCTFSVNCKENLTATP